MGEHKGSQCLAREAKSSWILDLALLKTSSAILAKCQFLWDYFLMVIRTIMPNPTTSQAWFKGQK
jgi:hypothetical protein